jgi:phosphoglycolate phosphatase
MLSSQGPFHFQNSSFVHGCIMSFLFTRHGIKAVLFDFDGTLAENALDFSLMREKADAAIASLTALPLPADRPLMEALAKVCASLDSDTAFRVRERAMRAITEVEVEAAGRATIFPFTLPMLEALRAEGTATAVITRNCPDAVFRVFPALREHVACVLTRDDVSRVKPHPEHINRALAIVGCKPGQSLMVGDHRMDIEAGKRAGTRTAGVASGESPCEDLRAADPDWLAPDAGELMRRLGVL